jgi:hypothetical protein
MNKKIENLIGQLTAMVSDNRSAQFKISEKIQKECDAIFKKNKALNEVIKKVQDSDEWAADESGFHTWVRFEVEDFVDTKQTNVLDALDNYISDFGYHWDRENQALLNFQGEVLAVQLDCDECNQGVWLTDINGIPKHVIEGSEFITDGEEDPTKRDKIIEAWCEKNQYWPGIVCVTQHGDVYPVKKGE